MKQDNSFYVEKSTIVGFIPNYGYDLTTGEFEQQPSNSCFEKHFGADRIYLDYYIHCTKINILKWDKNNNYLGYETYLDETVDVFHIDYKLKTNEHYIAVMLYGTTLIRVQFLEEELGYIVYPHYKQLKKNYKKESGEVFFREQLSGKISLHGSDYEFIKNTPLGNDMAINVYNKDDNKIATANFNKTDCKFDDFRKAVELKLSFNDKYTKILDALENTYDLIKLAPAITPIKMTKRSIMQIYIQGENTISSYAGGTYWETEVDSPVDDADELERHYYFSRGPKFLEVNLTGFNYQINAVYGASNTSNIWNAKCKETVLGVEYEFPCSIVLHKIYNANQSVNPQTVGTVNLLSSGTGNGLQTYSSTSAQCIYDTYRIEIYNGANGTGNLIYKSRNLYGKDSSLFTLSSGNGLYPMDANPDLPAIMRVPDPYTFNLGECLVEYQIWGRVVCDSDAAGLYDLPYDDFALARNNYRKCIGLSGFNTANSIVKVIQSQEFSDEPTPFGINDFGDYFTTPNEINPQIYYYYPLAKSSWANTSLWVRFNDEEAFEDAMEAYYKEYYIKDCYHIADVIKVLLSTIGTSVTHEKTAEYSSFLYGHSGASAASLGNTNLYISQKTNVLKGEYDQPAQKAEIKLKQVTDMLRDCFRCYWFIDDENRFRIEHISYFMNGLSYSSPITQIDLSSKFDKFNRKCVIHDQEVIEYEKSELISRYEFGYMDDVTKVMGGDLVINILNGYVPKDKTEEINIDGFTADVDYMLFMPGDFSEEGFALLLADSDKKIPIVHKRIRDEKQHDGDGIYIEAWVQNWYASFNQLADHYTYDFSGSFIECNNIEEGLSAVGIKRCMKQNIRFSIEGAIDLYKLISVGNSMNGYIEEMTEDIESNVKEIELRYTPS